MEIRPILSALLRSKTGAVLVAAQIALTLAIVSNAAYVVITRTESIDRPSGIDEANVFDIYYAEARPIEDRRGVVQKDLETLRAIPGVVSASTTNQMPLGMSGWGTGITMDPKNPNAGIGVAMYLGDERTIDSMGLQLVEGRAFTPEEMIVADSRTDDRDPATIIITRHVAKQLFPDGSSAVGKTVWYGSGDEATILTIVGVVDKLISPWAQTSLSDDAYDSIIGAVRFLNARFGYVVRTQPGQRARVMRDAEAQLTALRTDRVLLRSRSMDQIREQRYRGEKTGAGMLIAISIGLLIITGSGIVGVASLWVTQRRKQIGVRRALGAGRLDIVRYFVTENLMITTAGAALGVGLAIGLNQFLIEKLELPRLPVTYLVGGVLSLWTLGILAVLGPAWRAAAVPPAIATRSA
jgi:putative ABC transport system permease protein